MYKRLIAVLGAVAIAAGSAACSPDSAGPTAASAAAAKGSGTGGGQTADRLEIRLSAPAGSIFANAKGKAKFRDRGGEQQLEIEVENIPAGTVIDFAVGGAAIGSATADALGNASLRLNSDEGDTVPAVAGQSVDATSGGSPVVSGSF